MRQVIVIVCGVALAGIVVSAQSGDPAAGKTAFAERHCGTCHKTDKDDAKGGKMSTVLGEKVGSMSPAQIKEWLTEPAAMEAKLPKKPPVLMSSYLKNQKPPLSDAEVANLTAYLKSLAPK